MRKERIINTNEVNIGSTLLLTNSKKVKVKGLTNSMFPTINNIFSFITNEGEIKPNEVERIYK